VLPQFAAVLWRWENRRRRTLPAGGPWGQRQNARGAPPISGPVEV